MHQMLIHSLIQNQYMTNTNGRTGIYDGSRHNGGTRSQHVVMIV